MALVAGCGTVTPEVIEVPVETTPSEVTAVATPQDLELDLKVIVKQDVQVKAATAIGVQKARAPQVGEINGNTRRPVRLVIRGNETFDAKGGAKVVGAPKHGFRVGKEALVGLANTDRETDMKVKATFNHQFKGGSTVIGATKPGLNVE